MFIPLSRLIRRPVVIGALVDAVVSHVVLASFVLGAATSSMAARRHRGRGDRGQAMTEYVLLLLGVAAIALLVTGWAARTGKIGDLLDRVFDTITGRVA